ncbi:MAG: glycosyltransferase [Lewinellaceae bacterium]|nr:glycosyltransferase [Lewinellaceae bacterium]
MKRIICTVTNDLTYDQRMIRICTSLSEAGYHVLLVGRELENSKPLAKQAFDQKRFRLLFNKGKLFYFEYNLRLFLFLLFASFEIVNVVDLDTLLPGFLVSRLKHKVCVYDAHEYFTEVPEVVGRPVVKKVWQALAKSIIPRLKYCYTVGEHLASVFEENYGTTFTVIRNVPYKKEGTREVDSIHGQIPFIVLYQGVLNEGRGLEEAIQAMVYLEGAQLWLAGEGDLSSDLRALSRNLGVESKVKFLGRIPPAELFETTKKAHLGLNLLKNKGLNYYFSLANKAFDYIQAGIPSLNMAFPEYEKINRRYQVFVLLETLDPEKIAEVVESLRNDNVLYANIVKGCWAASDYYTWENEEKTLLNFYRNVLTELK